MVRPTQQEIDEWNARMAEPEEDEDDYEVVLFDENGNPVTTMPFSRAKTYLAKRGIDLGDPIAESGAGDPNAANPGKRGGAPNAPGAPGGAEGGVGGAAQGAPPARASSRYFGKQGRGATAPAAGADPNYADPTGNPPR